MKAEIRKFDNACQIVVYCKSKETIEAYAQIMKNIFNMDKIEVI
jgi:hypothetical protein